MPHRAKLISSATRIYCKTSLFAFTGPPFFRSALSRDPLTSLSVFVCKVWFADAKRDLVQPPGRIFRGPGDQSDIILAARYLALNLRGGVTSLTGAPGMC